MNPLSAHVGRLLKQRARTYRMTDTVANMRTTETALTLSTSEPCMVQAGARDLVQRNWGQEVEGEWVGFFHSTAALTAHDLIRMMAGPYTGTVLRVAGEPMKTNQFAGIEHQWVPLATSDKDPSS